MSRLLSMPVFGRLLQWLAGTRKHGQGRLGVWRAVGVALWIACCSPSPEAVACPSCSVEDYNHCDNLPVFAIVSEGKNTQRRLCDCGFWDEYAVFRVAKNEHRRSEERRV